MNKNLVIGFLILIIAGMGFMLMQTNNKLQQASTIFTQDQSLYDSENDFDFSAIRKEADEMGVKIYEMNKDDQIKINDFLISVIQNYTGVIGGSTGQKPALCRHPNGLYFIGEINGNSNFLYFPQSHVLCWDMMGY